MSLGSVLLRNQNIERLGCCRESLPYVVPVNYFFDGEDIYIHSTPGHKIQIMRANPYVCLHVDEVEVIGRRLAANADLLARAVSRVEGQGWKSLRRPKNCSCD